MPQEFQILRCCECEKFQIHHVKKAKKWQCKVCGLKQSMKRAFFIGSSRDCRVNVQKLNFQAGEREMKRKLGESFDSVDSDNPSLEIGDDFTTKKDEETDWFDKNDGMDENDWVEENDWVDEKDWVDENDGMNENSLSDFEDEIPRKKQRCESYSESETVEKDSNFIHSNENVEDLGDFLKQDGNSSKPIGSSVNISSADAQTQQECDSFKATEGNVLTGVAKSRTNSKLKPTHGFQLILNEAKKQRSDLNYDLDW